jgi:serine/threonine-protein kinase
VLDGRYVLEGVMATGGMGVVYRAHHAAIGTRFAVKVLKASSACDPDAVARFRREARTAGALEHPNIVRVHDFGVLLDGRSYFVMELLEGVDLATEIARCGRLSPARAAKIALEILDALAAAHASDVVHRDLKPENVMRAAASAPRSLG